MNWYGKKIVRIEIRRAGTDVGHYALLVGRDWEQRVEAQYQDVDEARRELAELFPGVRVVNRSGYSG